MAQYRIKLSGEWIMNGEDKEDALDNLEDYLAERIEEFGVQHDFEVEIVEEKVASTRKKS